jgi:hypothetical protein
MEFVVELIQARLHESAVIEEYCRRTQRVITNDLHLTPKKHNIKHANINRYLNFFGDF